MTLDAVLVHRRSRWSGPGSSCSRASTSASACCTAILGRDEAGRRAAINTIGPLWDGNEVWLIVAGAAMFAAFPGWYATMFSGVVPGAGGAAGGADRPRHLVRVPRQARQRDLAAQLGRPDDRRQPGRAAADRGRRSAICCTGCRSTGAGEYTGTFWNLLQPYGLFTGVTLVAICVTHGATFIAPEDRPGRSRGTAACALARRSAPVTGLLVLGFVIWTHVDRGQGRAARTRWRSSPCWPCSPRPGWPHERSRGLGVRGDHGRDGGARVALDLHRAVPAG